MKKYTGVASFDVDAQKGFSGLCPNELPVEGAVEIVPHLNKMAEYTICRLGSKDAHPGNAVWTADKDHKILSPVEGHKNADLYWPAHCVVGTKGFELLDGLPAPEDYDFLVYKGLEKDLHPYGACYHDQKDVLSTGVLEFLEFKGIHTVIVGGLATDYCVSKTVCQLLSAGVNVILYLPACRGIEPKYEVAVEQMYQHSKKSTSTLSVARNEKELERFLEAI